MKLAVRKEPGAIPGAGFHYTLHPVKIENSMQAVFFELIGYVVIEVIDEYGEILIRQGLAALNHQVEIAIYTEKALKGRSHLQKEVDS